jgi:predicted permease
MRFYNALLHLYPKSFRGEYGEEMCAVFARGNTSRPAAVLEVLRNAPAAHADVLRQDLRYTARTLARAPGFAAIALAVLALGIGANTAVFSVTDYVLVRSLPFPSPDRLVTVWETLPGYSRMELSPADFRDWKRMNSVFQNMGAYTDLPVNLVGEGNPERIDSARVTGEFFDVLGVQPFIGRSIGPADDRLDAPMTAVLSYGLWQGVFGGDAGVLGRRISLDGKPCVVIGVMPPSFHYPDQSIELWLPFQLPNEGFVDRNDNWFHGIARLRNGVSLEQARAEMSLIAGQLRRQYPKELKHTGADVNRIRDEISNQSRLLLLALSGAALCVLLITCTNVANLLIARALNREKELSIRAALGAGRERLIRQLVTESLVLSAAGGLLGVVLARLTLPLLTRLVPSLPGSGTPGIDPRVLAFAGILTVLTGIGFGIVPALRLSSNGDLRGLQDRSRSARSSASLRSALIVTEIALSIVLVISAGLLLRALVKIQSADPGFRSEGVLTMQTALPMPKYSTPAKRAEFYDRVLTEVRALPGVSSAAYISFLPMTMTGGIFPVDLDGTTVDRSEGNTASLRYITPGLFDTLQIPLRAGRDIAEADDTSRPAVAVVSESFARRYWPDQNPVGRHFKFAFADRTVVGLAGDIRVRGLQRPSEPQVYLPCRQQPGDDLIGYTPKDLAIRSSGNLDALVQSVRRIIRGADPEQPISQIRTLAGIVEGNTAPRTVQVRILGAFALLALLLAGIGIHGLLSFTVSNRRAELAVRIALGARPTDILKIVLREGMVLAAFGAVFGVALAYAAGRAMEALLAGVAPADEATFFAAIALCVTMTLAGSLVPAVRALRIDPIASIRAE